jgi:hypothetical protein
MTLLALSSRAGAANFPLMCCMVASCFALHAQAFDQEVTTSQLAKLVDGDDTACV